MRQIIIALLIFLFAAVIIMGLQDLREQRGRERRFRQYEDSLLLKMPHDSGTIN